MAYNLTPYLAQPFEMQAGDWTITSPVPTVRAGKLMAAFQELQAEQFRRAEAGEPPADTIEIPGWPSDDEGFARLMLGDAEYERLEKENCPGQYIINASMAALYYWANGGSEAAVTFYNEAITDQLEHAKATAPKAETRKRSKNGRRMG